MSGKDLEWLDNKTMRQQKRAREDDTWSNSESKREAWKTPFKPNP